jgi:hypothetical protein
VAKAEVRRLRSPLPPFTIYEGQNLTYSLSPSQCKQIRDECLEKFKKIITLLTVTVFFIFAFFNKLFDAPRKVAMRMEKNPF